MHGQIDLGTCVAFASLLSMQAGSTRVPENAVQQVLAGKGCKVTSLLKPVAWMFVIAALLIALDSAAGVGVLILLQRGIDSGVAAGDMSTIGL
ncbi:hypothetical protein ELI85_29230, partial [Klebsiella pneumoniae]|nr:hypothetical protein [Klebsiella pneumoniae]